METNTVNAQRVKRRVPIEIRVRTYIIVPIYLFIVSLALIKTHQPGFALFLTAILALFFLANHGFDWGYQFAFDDKRIYQRPKGWGRLFRRLPWYSISYNDLTRMETILGADGALKSRFFPFEFVLLFGKSGAEGDNVVIYPQAFRDGSIKQFLSFLHSRRPEVFSDEVRNYMLSDQPL